MTAKITFYPVGNADSSLLETSNNKYVLIDFANKRDPDNPDDKRIDLVEELNKKVDDKFDVVTFTHADEDHICGFSEYFYLEHAVKYQSDDRKKIIDLWVPAAIILEKSLDNPEAEVLRAEARHRLRSKKGIKVFSNPELLHDWLTDEGINIADVSHLIVNAGTLVPGWSLEDEGVEFFVHSPFSTSIEGVSIERNEACIIMQAAINNSKKSKIIFGADAVSGLWDDIIRISRYYNREDRLEWDVFHISHHSSYKSLNKEDRGVTKTIPIPRVKWLFEEKSNDNSILISPSKIIPQELGVTQPPHREAANYYEDVAKMHGGEYKVTMEFPNKTKPRPLEIIFDDFGATIIKTFASTFFVTDKPAPRAG